MVKQVNAALVRRGKGSAFSELLSSLLEHHKCNSVDGRQQRLRRRLAGRGVVGPAESAAAVSAATNRGIPARKTTETIQRVQVTAVSAAESVVSVLWVVAKTRAVQSRKERW